jgi:phage recombination protein Bet
MTETKTPSRELERRSTLLERLGAKYMPGTPKSEVLAVLNQTAFKTKDGPPTNAQVAALLVVADQYGLNPWTKEIFAFPDKQNGIVPVVGVDGWNRIANEHPQFAGEELELPPRDEWERIDEDAKLCPPWVRILVYRRDRDHPTDHTEYLDECYRPAFEGKGQSGKAYKKLGPWQSHTKRMLEHKARIQARRIAFGFSGIYDQDEAERIVTSDYDYEAEAVEVELLGAEGWTKLLEAGTELGLSADDLLANAAALGHEGPGSEMPRDIAVRIFRAMHEQPGDGDHDDEAAVGAQEATEDVEDAEVVVEAEEVSAVATEAPDDELDADEEAFLAATDKAPKTKASRAQLNMIAALLKKSKLPEGEWRRYMESLTGVRSRRELDKQQAGAFIDYLSGAAEPERQAVAS